MNESITEELLPCPFCARTGAALLPIRGGFDVVCDHTAGGCGASCGIDATKESASARWNRRQAFPRAASSPTADQMLTQIREYHADDIASLKKDPIGCSHECWAAPKHIAWMLDEIEFQSRRIAELEQSQRSGWQYAREVEDEYRKRMGRGFGDPEPPPEASQIAWLVERQSNGRAVWYTSNFQWTTDANEAMWFVRKQHAELFCFNTEIEAHAVEHMFCTGPAQAKSAPLASHDANGPEVSADVQSEGEKCSGCGAHWPLCVCPAFDETDGSCDE